jgi:hypothetical protein
MPVLSIEYQKKYLEYLEITPKDRIPKFFYQYDIDPKRKHGGSIKIRNSFNPYAGTTVVLALL